MFDKKKIIGIRHWYKFLRGQEHSLDRLKRHRIFNLRTRLFPLFNKTKEPKRFLFLSMFHQSYDMVDMGLATALKLRGHDVKMIGCGGISAFCKKQKASVFQLKGNFCRTCKDQMLEYFNAYGLPNFFLSDYIYERDVEEAKKIAYTQQLDELLELKFMGVHVGKIAWVSLYQYFKGYTFKLEGEREEIFRCALESSILMTKAMTRIIQEYKPNTCIVTNGKFLHWGVFVEIAKAKSINFVTWEEMDILPYAIVAEHDGLAHEQRIDKIWDAERNRKLSDKEKSQLTDHLKKWENLSLLHKNSTIIHDRAAIENLLKLRSECPLISLFPNVIWDASSVGFDKAFTSMFDWLFSVVEFAIKNHGIDVVIRAHPGETKLSQWYYRSSTPICKEIISRYPDLPSNIKLVDSEDAISSYSLGMMSDIVMVYTSTLGLEFALKGRRPWVAGDAYYCNKGFTVDIQSKEHMFSLLRGKTLRDDLTKEQLEDVRRFAYIVRFKRNFPLPYIDKNGDFDPPSFNVFLPGADTVFTQLCDKLLNKDFFLCDL